MEVLNKINEGLNHLKNKDIEAALEAFSNSVAISGQNIQEEIKWAYSERNFEVAIEITNSLFAFSWMLYALKMLSINEEDELKNKGKIEGINDFYKNIMNPVITNLVDYLDKNQKSISRKLANNILVLKQGFQNLENLNEDN